MQPTAGTGSGYTAAHPAWDYPVGIGTNLVAVKDGVIGDIPGVDTRRLIGHLNNTQHWPKAGGGSPNSGNVINVSHGGGEYTSYLHVSPYDINALRGRQVRRGEVIGKSGHNGWSTGPHLHFEVWTGGARILPGPWLNAIVGGGMAHPVDLLRVIGSEIEGFDSAETHKGTYDKQLLGAWGNQPLEAYIRHAWKVNQLKRGDLINQLAKTKASAADITKLWKASGLTTNPPADYVKYWTGRDFKLFINDLINQNEWKQAKFDGKILGPGNYIFKP